MKKNYLLVIVTLSFITLLSGCNMFKGAGKDVEKAGESIQETAEDAGKSIQKTVDENK